MSEYFLRTLYVQTPGTRLILEGNALKALREGVAPRRLPLHALDSIIVAGGVDVSTPLLLKCADDGRPIHFGSRSGGPRALVEGPISGRGRLRRRQFACHDDPQKRDVMAAQIVSGKIGQMTWALRQWARDADTDAAARLRAAADEVAEVGRGLGSAGRTTALGLEGAATRTYFAGLGAALRHQDWSGRSRRPALDPANCTLSFLYGLTRVAVHGAIQATGLDPFVGYLHGDLDGQPSLVLDLMEEFRPAADRLALAALNRRQLRDEHFTADITGAVRLTDAGREILFTLWHEHRQRKVHTVGHRGPLQNAVIPFIQANTLANALRHDTVYSSHQLAVK